MPIRIEEKGEHLGYEEKIIQPNKEAKNEFLVNGEILFYIGHILLSSLLVIVVRCTLTSLSPSATGKAS